MPEIYSFTVNGILRETDKVKPLLRYLRDDLDLTSVKDGCSEGACGTCTILVDGRAVRSCTLTTARAAGKHILTVEGLSKEEQEAFVTATFARLGQTSAQTSHTVGHPRHPLPVQGVQSVHSSPFRAASSRVSWARLQAP